MKTLFVISAIVALLAGGAAAQNHVIIANGFSFQDSVSGTTSTTVPFGTTIEWQNNSGFHLVLDGTDPAAVNTGNMLNFLLDPNNPTFLWTPPCPGVYPYYCFPHFAFGMVGTITVTGSAPAIDGSGEDFTIDTTVNGAYNPGCQYLLASPGDILSTTLSSPMGTYDGFGPLLLAQVFASGSAAPTGPLGFPELHVNTPGVVIILNAVPGPLGPYVMTPGGLTVANSMPVALMGFSFHLQGIVLSPTANNGFFATTDARSISVQ